MVSTLLMLSILPGSTFNLFSIHLPEVSLAFTPFYLPNPTHFHQYGTDKSTPANSAFCLLKNAPWSRSFCLSHQTPGVIPSYKITLGCLYLFRLQIRDPALILRPPRVERFYAESQSPPRENQCSRLLLTPRTQRGTLSHFPLIEFESF